MSELKDLSDEQLQRYYASHLIELDDKLRAKKNYEEEFKRRFKERKP